MPTTPTRTRGRGSQVPARRKLAVLTMAAEGATVPHICQSLSMAHTTVRAILAQAPDLHAQALDALDAAIPEAADAWLQAMREAAALGKHQPARDLLLSRKVIEPTPATAPPTNVGIKIVLGTEAHPLPDPIAHITTVVSDS